MKNQSTELTEIRKIDKIKNKVTGLIERIGKRNLIIAGAVLLIGVAVALNFALFSGADDGGYDYDQPSGSITDNGNNSTTDTSAEYFSATQVSRQRARDEALEVLQAVVDDPDSTDTAKAEAMESIAAIADEIQTEADIESLITAKGFDKCVAVLNGDTASIVVSAEGLQASQIAQINAIVYEQAGIAPSGVTIITK